LLELSDAGLRVRLAFASAHAGPNELEIGISNSDGTPAKVNEVTFIAANSAAGVEPIHREAMPARQGLWEIKDVTLVPAGEWSVRVEALVSDFEKPIFEGTLDLR
jgi:copper transport protein